MLTCVYCNIRISFSRQRYNNWRLLKSMIDIQINQLRHDISSVIFVSYHVFDIFSYMFIYLFSFHLRVNCMTPWVVLSSQQYARIWLRLVYNVDVGKLILPSGCLPTCYVFCQNIASVFGGCWWLYVDAVLIEMTGGVMNRRLLWCYFSSVLWGQLIVTFQPDLSISLSLILRLNSFNSQSRFCFLRHLPLTNSFRCQLYSLRLNYLIWFCQRLNKIRRLVIFFLLYRLFLMRNVMFTCEIHFYWRKRTQTFLTWLWQCLFMFLERSWGSRRWLGWCFFLLFIVIFYQLFCLFLHHLHPDRSIFLSI